MAIEANNPTIVPETVIAEKVFDKWWVTRLVVRAAIANNPAIVIVDLQQYRDVGDGTIEFGGNNTSFRIDDLFAEAAADPELAAVIAGLFGKIKSIGDSKGVL